MKKLYILLLMVTAYFLAGCDSIYFYESSKLALSFETRPDPSKPVSGSLSASTHMATVIPPQQKDDGSWEAVSLINYFNMSNDSENGLVIDSVFITGDAYSELNGRGRLPDIFNSVADVNVTQFSVDNIDLIRDILKIRLRQGDQVAQKILAELESEFAAMLKINEYPFNEFNRYILNEGELESRLINSGGNFYSYLANLKLSIIDLENYIKINKESAQDYIGIYNSESERLARISTILRVNKKVITAVNYCQKLLQ